MFLKVFSRDRGILKNSFLLMSGTGIAQAIPLIFSPLLTRIYSPEDFGRLAFFMACSSIFTLLATGLYELAILLPKKDIVAFNLMFFIGLLAFIVSIFCFVALLVYGYFFNGFSLNAKISNYLLILPLSIFFASTFQALNYWLNRKQKYSLINFSKISQTSVTVIISIILGYFGCTKNGLIWGFVVGAFIATIPFFYLIIKKYAIIHKNKVVSVAKEFINYPKLMLPTSIMNTAASQTPIFFINKYYNQSIVGSYSFSFRILTAPVAIISAAIGQIYYKKIVDRVNGENKRIFPDFFNTTKILLILSFVLFTPLFIWGEEIFSFVFGAEWKIAGKYVEILAIAVLIKFIVSPLSTVFYAINRLKELALWQISYFVSTILIFVFGTKYSIETMLWIYVFNEIALYSLYFILMCIVIKKFEQKNHFSHI